VDMVLQHHLLGMWLVEVSKKVRSNIQQSWILPFRNCNPGKADEKFLSIQCWYDVRLSKTAAGTCFGWIAANVWNTSALAA